MEFSAPGFSPAVFGAAVSPEKIKPVLPRPKDFDSFWTRKIKELRAIAPNPVVAPQKSIAPELDHMLVTMNHVNGTKVYGQMSKPKKKGKYPAMLQLQWASPPYPLAQDWIAYEAKRGMIVLNIQPHNTPVRAEPSYYASLPSAIKNYAGINTNDREKNYFVEMYLRGIRALDYLTKDPDWDGKTLILRGTSMGGQQAVCSCRTVSKGHPLDGERASWV